MPAAFAQSNGLPQGHTSDELPALPPSQGQAPAGDATPGIEAQPVDFDASVEADYYVDTDPSALSDFREPLSPYGTWVEDPTYGTVWVPSAVVVGADFAPYQTAGHWEMTADGDWLWVSDYEWGHVPFHYGRWVWIAGRGWAWIPGRVYAPAWVVWRTSDYGYIGWAPMAPRYYWSSGVAVRFYSSPPTAYIFCPSSHVFHHHVHTYVVRDHSVVRRIGAHSRPYQPASPSVGGGSAQAKAPAQPSPGSDAVSPPPGGSQRRVSYPKGPSLAEAKIPAGAEPKMRSSHDPRALTFATKSSTARWKSMPPSARSFNAAPGRGSMPSDRSDAGGRHMAPSHGRAGSFEQPMRSPSPQGGFDRAPSHQSGFDRAPSPSRGFDRGPAPSPRSQPSVAPPSRSFQPPAPSRAPSRSISPSPSPRSQPSAPAVRSAPSRSSAPSVRPSAPSAPSRVAPSSSPAPSKSVKSSSSSSSSKSSSSRSSSRDKK